MAGAAGAGDGAGDSGGADRPHAAGAGADRGGGPHRRRGARARTGGEHGDLFAHPDRGVSPRSERPPPAGHRCDERGGGARIVPRARRRAGKGIPVPDHAGRGGLAVRRAVRPGMRAGPGARPLRGEDSMRLLVTGGAGYIGAVTVRRLRQAGHAPIVLDDLSAGHREAVAGTELVVGDFGERALVRDLLASRTIDAVVHFAASSLVGESVLEPAKYYRNNLERSLALLDVLRERGVMRIVLSSTAAVYGEPVAIPMDEDHPTRPTNPYGETKLALEKALRWYHAAYGFASVSLRYFNAAGASSDGALGEVHDPETHLVPNVLRAALTGEPVPVFGTDYATHDGTAVRDYVHVEDLADAHVRALEGLEKTGGASVLNH